jgi:hypothetical protein
MTSNNAARGKAIADARTYAPKRQGSRTNGERTHLLAPVPKSEPINAAVEAAEAVGAEPEKVSLPVEKPIHAAVEAAKAVGTETATGAAVELFKPCPACGTDSFHHRETDRYIHSNGTRNNLCWAHIASGRNDDFHAPNQFDIESPDPNEPPDDEHQDDEPNETPTLAAYCLTRNQLRDLPNPEPLIDNILDRGTVALFYGKWGSYKSFIALDWAACIATGKPWQGRTATPGRVLYIAAEGAHGLKVRTHAWEVGWATKIPDDQLTVLRRPINLTNPGEIYALEQLIQWGGYTLVIIDTLARCMVGGDENSAKDCGLVVDAMHRLREATPNGRGVILGVHHAGKDGKTFRGSSAFEAGADTVYSATQDGAMVVVNREKRKDGPQQDEHRLGLDPIEGTESCVISRHREVARPDRAEKLLATFRQHFATSGASKTELRKVSDLSDGSFYRAVNDLLKSCDLINHGTDLRPFYRQADE